MKLNLRGSIKQSLIECEDTRFIRDKVITVYNYQGIPHSEGAVLHYMCNTWDFTVNFITEVGGVLMRTNIRYKDLNDTTSALTIEVSPFDQTTIGHVRLISCDISKIRGNGEECVNWKTDDSLLATSLTIEEWKQHLICCVFGCSNLSFLPDEFWDKIYKAANLNRG